MHSSPLRLRFAILLLVVAAFAMPWFSPAQTNTTALSGTVLDATGALIPGAAISLSSAASGTQLSTQSKSKGEFSFEQLAPGSYTLKVVASGFAEQVRKLDLLISTPVSLNIKMVAGTNEVVEVETTLPTINTTDASLGKAFDSAQVQNLPYLANNVTYLLSLQPGVLALDSGAQSGGLNQDPRTGIVNGARGDQTNITLDGVDNNDQIFGYAFNGGLRSTRDSVEEFRVTTTNANADAGRSSGAQVSLVTRSGTNVIHGSAYELYRDPATTSNNWYNKQAQLNSGEPNIAAKVLEHTYGGTLGAPLKKNKLFFFGAYEGFKQASNIQVSRTVPSTLGGGGLVTGNVTYLACTDAACGSTVPKTLTPAEIASLDGRSKDKACATSACAVPSTSAAAVAYFNMFPQANSIGGDGYNTGTYNFASPAPIHQITNIARLDYNITPRQTLFVRGNLQSDNEASSLQFPGLPAASNVFSNNKGIAAGHVWSINDKLTNNFRYGFVRLGNASRGTGSQPYVAFGAFDNLTATTTSSVYKVVTNNFIDDVSYVKGRHILQAGANIYVVSNGQYFDAPLQSYANISPNLLATAAIAGQGATLDPGAFHCADCGVVSSDFQGYYNNAIISNVGAIETAQSGTEFLVKNNQLVPQAAGIVPTHTFRNVEQEYYVQDQWKVTSRLTITAGLRYVYLGTPYEKDGQQIAPTIPLNSFLANRIAAANTGSAYTTDVAFRASGSPNGQPNFWTAQKLNFAPRVAFAYASADGKNSVRGGFALAYDHFGQGIIDAYQSNPQSLLSLSQSNLATFTNIDTNPRFTGFHDVPMVAGATTALDFPYTPPENPFTFDYSINDVQKTPYAENFNLSLEHEFAHNLGITASYVGRLGRHLVTNLDVAAPANYHDAGSAQDYFTAVTAYAKLVDQGVDAAAIPQSGYFQNLFPNFSATDDASGITYTGAQGYYASLAANRGNETNTLYEADTDPNASASGQSQRFFYPQTSSVFAQSTIGTSNYNALQLSMRQALRYGLTYDVNYTFSKSFDLGSDPERNGVSGSVIINTFNIAQMYGVSDFDARHNLTADYTLPMPFGHGAPFLNGSRLADAILGGFQLNGVVHYSTGFPFSAYAGGRWGTNFAFNSNLVQTGPIPTGGHRYVSSGPDAQTETALKGITAAQATANLRFAYPGESGQRNNFRADGYLSIDDGFSKSIHTWREQELKITAEVFNVINTNRFNTLQTDGSAFNFGSYVVANSESTYRPTSLLLQPRQMQFSAKYRF